MYIAPVVFFFTKPCFSHLPGPFFPLYRSLMTPLQLTLHLPSPFAAMTRTRCHIRLNTGFPSMIDTLSCMTSLILSRGTSQTVLRHVESTIKTEFSKTARVYFCHMWNWAQIPSCLWNWFSHFAFVILWDCSLAAFPEILNICCLWSTSKFSSCLWAPLSLARWPFLLFHRCWQPLSLVGSFIL